MTDFRCVVFFVCNFIQFPNENAPRCAANFGSSRNLGGRAARGARLRTRKVTGRDASLPAPLLMASLGLVGRGTVGALPQTPQGTLSLDPARGRRKGTKSPLDPFSRLSWSRFHAPSACSFFVLRLSPCLLPPTPGEEPLFRVQFYDTSLQTCTQPSAPE